MTLQILPLPELLFTYLTRKFEFPGVCLHVLLHVVFASEVLFTNCTFPLFSYRPTALYDFIPIYGTWRKGSKSRSRQSRRNGHSSHSQVGRSICLTSHFHFPFHKLELNNFQILVPVVRANDRSTQSFFPPYLSAKRKFYSKNTIILSDTPPPHLHDRSLCKCVPTSKHTMTHLTNSSNYLNACIPKG